MLSHSGLLSLQLECPLWVNADILYGPGTQQKQQDSKSMPVDSTTFLQLTHSLLPGAVISPGWKTSDKPVDDVDFYSDGKQ